jgi:hypothetical protein
MNGHPTLVTGYGPLRLLPNSDERRHAAHVQDTARQRGRRHDELPDRIGPDLPELAPGGDDDDVTVFASKRDAPVRRDG